MSNIQPENKPMQETLQPPPSVVDAKYRSRRQGNSIWLQTDFGNVHIGKQSSPSDAEAGGALNDDCGVNCFVEALFFCVVLMVQTSQALPSTGAFSMGSLQDWVPLHKAGCMGAKCRCRDTQSTPGCADKT